MVSAVFLVFYILLLGAFQGYQWRHPTYQVHGESMTPTFVEDQRVQLTMHHHPKRFDVVVFQPKDSQEPLYIKRVIGLPGEEVTYREGQLFIHQVPISDVFGSETEDFQWSDYSHQLIPADCYFVMGDNRQVSKDSRTFGWISQKQIIGIVREDNEK